MKPVSVLQRFYNVKEIAQQIGVSTKTIRRWFERGELHFHRLGRQLRVTEEDLLTSLAKHRR
jgi:excisionase family DNA binding protein